MTFVCNSSSGGEDVEQENASRLEWRLRVEDCIQQWVTTSNNDDGEVILLNTPWTLD